MKKKTKQTKTPMYACSIHADLKPTRYACFIHEELAVLVIIFVPAQYRPIVSFGKKQMFTDTAWIILTCFFAHLLNFFFSIALSIYNSMYTLLQTLGIFVLNCLFFIRL
eukprot:TRINITY_DN6620_c1_g2_i3.p1 TRINITY_DN6620_c1_g2~~TRINITY_DN6620_c1_g2_i3.p1  ORF type:complete len:109 (+),score=9.79 TRINITY_DN6620_c1_g2_i3:124-450(+)